MPTWVSLRGVQHESHSLPDETSGNSRTQFLVLAFTFQFVGLVVDLAIGAAAGTARHLVAEHPNAMTWLDRLAGTVYLALALWLGIDLLH